MPAAVVVNLKLRLEQRFSGDIWELLATDANAARLNAQALGFIKACPEWRLLNGLATEVHGKTRKNKYLSGNISVYFRVIPWQGP